MVLTERELEALAADRMCGPVPPLCPDCGYNLTGLSEPRCPECGGRFRWKQILDHSGRVFFERSRLRTINRDTATARRFIAAAWGAWLVSRLIPIPLVASALALSALLTAFASLYLGSQVLQVLRLPDWAREYLAEPPDIARGVVVMAASGLLLLVGILFG